MNILLKISFIGSHYAGWQVQKNAPTVQGAVCAAVYEALGTAFPVTGCSRTDSGVHACGFFCTVDTGKVYPRIPLTRLPAALSRLLPEDISVMSAVEVPAGFHPRYNSLGKEYFYLIWNGIARNPFYTERALYVPRRLDEEKMNLAAGYFEGERDFTSFMAAGSKITDAVRRIDSACVSRDGELIKFTVSGNGFLYNMVRIMVGTLIEVSDGKKAPDDIPGIIDAKSRRAAGFTAPPYGLYLGRVFYE